jgi:hypothetical protein
VDTLKAVQWHQWSLSEYEHKHEQRALEKGIDFALISKRIFQCANQTAMKPSNKIRNSPRKAKESLS